MSKEVRSFLLAGKQTNQCSFLIFMLRQCTVIRSHKLGKHRQWLTKWKERKEEEKKIRELMSLTSLPVFNRYIPRPILYPQVSCIHSRREKNYHRLSDEMYALRQDAANRPLFDTDIDKNLHYAPSRPCLQIKDESSRYFSYHFVSSRDVQLSDAAGRRARGEGPEHCIVVYIIACIKVRPTPVWPSVTYLYTYTYTYINACNLYHVEALKERGQTFVKIEPMRYGCGAQSNSRRRSKERKRAFILSRSVGTRAVQQHTPLRPDNVVEISRPSVL